jgi:hypothetical protein
MAALDERAMQPVRAAVDSIFFWVPHTPTDCGHTLGTNIPLNILTYVLMTTAIYALWHANGAGPAI